jgi:phospholipid/cholesterol/gamma-HCH transport system substrate-binding protein
VSGNLSKGFYKPGDAVPGEMAIDMFGQVKSFADPLSKKVQTALVSVDKMVDSLNAFWDKTATSEIEESFSVLKLTIKRFGNVAINIEDLVREEKIKLTNILSNVESISYNLKKSNDQIAGILGNAKTITDDLVTADFKKVIGNATETLKNLNLILATAEKGEGTLGKLLKDEKLYNELVTTNKDLQNLVIDIQMHPERFIHFSVFGAKTKGVPLNQREELKLRQLLDSVPN